jgi:hypothetical protein
MLSEVLEAPSATPRRAALQSRLPIGIPGGWFNAALAQLCSLHLGQLADELDEAWSCKARQHVGQQALSGLCYPKPMPEHDSIFGLLTAQSARNDATFY